MSGGKREGAGRKPGPYGCKVTLAVRVSPDVKAFLAATGNMSNATDEAVRRSTAFRQWSKAQQQRDGLHGFGGGDVRARCRK